MQPSRRGQPARPGPELSAASRIQPARNAHRAQGRHIDRLKTALVGNLPLPNLPHGRGKAVPLGNGHALAQEPDHDLCRCFRALLPPNPGIDVLPQRATPIQVAIGSGVNLGRQDILTISGVVQLPVDEFPVVVSKLDVLKEGLKRLTAPDGLGRQKLEVACLLSGDKMLAGDG